MASWLINARFRRQRLTGVQRYAHAVVAKLGQISSDPFALVEPGRSLPGAVAHLWEQGALPQHCGGLGLWSPANTGPLAVERQAVTIHDVAPLQHPEWFHPAFAMGYRVLLPRLAQRIRVVLTVSACSRDRILETCGIPEHKVRVARPGVDSRFRPARAESLADFRRQHGLERPYLLALASQDPRKNFARLVAAWGLIERHWPEVELVVAGGSAPIFAPTKQLAGPRLRWLGYFPESELPLLYAGAELFIYPSLYEGFGLPIVEAMACGVPVLTGRDRALQEAAGGAAEIVDVAEIPAIAAGIDRILSSAEVRSQLRQRGLAQAQTLKWERSAQDVVQALREFEIL